MKNRDKIDDLLFQSPEKVPEAHYHEKRRIFNHIATEERSQRKFFLKLATTTFGICLLTVVGLNLFDKSADKIQPDEFVSISLEVEITDDFGEDWIYLADNL